MGRMDGSKETERSQDERLLARAEEALTEIKVAQGLSEPHAAVLAALRIRLKGEAGKDLDALIAAAEDPEPDGSGLDAAIERSSGVSGPSLDDLLGEPDAPKRSLDDLF
jgi:hypothetical protein